MRTRLEWEWEKLDASTYRAKVIGGWVLMHTNHTTITDGKTRDMVQSESMCFLADKEHQWIITPPIVDERVEKRNLAKDFEPTS